MVGSGRTEVLRAIFGADQPDTGEILVDGARVRFRRRLRRCGAGWACCRRIERRRDCSSTGRCERMWPFQPAPLQPVRGTEPRREERVVRGLMANLQIAARGPGQPVATLSGGNQQKVVLARWLARQCRILLFDEPTRGVDIGAKEEIYRLIQDLAREGAAVLVVSSELKELSRSARAFW